MSVLDKLLDAVKLNDDYDEDDYLDDDLMTMMTMIFSMKTGKTSQSRSSSRNSPKNPKRMTMMISMMNRRLLFPNSPHPNPSLFRRQLSSRTSLHVLPQRSHQ